MNVDEKLEDVKHFKKQWDKSSISKIKQSS